MMKPHLLKTALIAPALALVALGSASCKKHKDAGCQVNMASLSGTYRLTALKYKASAGATEQDALSWREACENDDLIILKSDGTYQYQDAGTACSPNGSDNGTWSVSGNTLSSDGDMQGTIKSFDCSTLVYTTTDLYNTGDQLSWTLTKQ